MRKARRIFEVGKKYGRLTLIENTNIKRTTGYVWKCLCDCGNITYVPTSQIGTNSKSCGCYGMETHRTHNESNTRLYNIWCLMKARCYRKTNSSYNNYGGRGITVCVEWKNSYESFREWALKNGYKENLSIDRIDVNGNYCPENCRWADNSTQVNNRRPYGKIPITGIIQMKNGIYLGQVTVNGKRIRCGSSKDLETVIKKRNAYIKKHNLPNKLSEVIE
ncbi:MAG: hypothetical protein K6E97_03985 [Treponema sp.]|nr:hypothetical protein [Treponema sp.]